MTTPPIEPARNPKRRRHRRLELMIESGLDPAELARANREHDARYGFRLASPEAGLTSMRPPTYVRCLPGYRKPGDPAEAEAMRVAIWEWHRREIQP